MGWGAVLGFLVRRNFLAEPDGLRALVETNLTYRNLEDAEMPIHIVATDILTGGTVVLSEGPRRKAIIASAAIPVHVSAGEGSEDIVSCDARFYDDTADQSGVPPRSAASDGCAATAFALRPFEAACRRA